MPDGRKQRGRKSGAIGEALAMSYKARQVKKKALKKSGVQIALKDAERQDWQELKGFGYTVNKIFSEGIKSCMNQVAIKRMDESLYGEYEAFLMWSQRKTAYGYRHELRCVRANLNHGAKNYTRVVILSLSPCPNGGNMVVARYYPIKSNTIIRKEILSVRKKVEHIDKEILLFFANGGNHST